jgi:4a-hydroxytetrahydrobiopterin dehydratase
MQALTLAEIEQALPDLAGWKFEAGRLVRVWTFADFVQAMDFVNKVAEIAEAAGHHPDIDMRYSQVTLGLVTHDAGGITERDLAMARRLSSLLDE